MYYPMGGGSPPLFGNPLGDGGDGIGGGLVGAIFTLHSLLNVIERRIGFYRYCHTDTDTGLKFIPIPIPE